MQHSASSPTEQIVDQVVSPVTQPPVTQPPASAPSVTQPPASASPVSASSVSSIQVSVIIPAYNCDRYLQETIRSVQAQTLTEWELIIVNDGSTDNTAKVAFEQAQRDQRITVISQDNQGVSAARNAGAEVAQGEFIAFLDADDRWLPQKLETHLQHLQAGPKVGASFAKVRYINEAGRPTALVAKAPLRQLEAWNFLHSNPTITTSNVVLRKLVYQQVGGFDPAMNHSEDMDWFFRILCHGQWSIEGVNQVLVEYRTHNTGLSSSLHRMEAGWKRLMAKAEETAPAIAESYAQTARAYYLRYLARQSLRLNVPSKTGLDFMNRSLKADWTLLLREPRRTLLTALAVYFKHSLELLQRSSHWTS